MFILTLIFYNIFMFGYSAKTYDCRNGTVYLKMNEIAFFETQNFPWFLTKDEQSKCDLKFELADHPKKKNKMVFAFYQFPPVETTSDDFPSVFSVADDFSYLIRGDFPTRGYSIAEQGFIAFFDDPDKCPLEFLNEDKPFKIVHENQILHIRSNYFNNINRQQPCQWKFAAPVGYGFKMVVQKLNISATTSFSIQNSTDIITNEKSVRINHPYYNSDTFIQITLTKGDPNFVTDTEFQAYISIIRNSQKKANVTCNVSTNNTNIIWENRYNNKGYENSEQCFYELIIPSGSVVVVTAFGYLENNVDYIKYYEVGKSNTNKIMDYHGEPGFIVIDNVKDVVDKHIIWEFVSDGSVQSHGFSIIFEFIVCKCSIFVAECGTTDNVLMNIQYPIDKGFYCGNLNCSVMIGKCLTDLTLIEFSTKTSVSTNDIFKISSNNLTIFEIVDWNDDNHFTYLNTSHENVLHVMTSPSSNLNTLYFDISEFEAPHEIKINFSESNMTGIIDTALSPLTVVEKDLENLYFILYCPYPKLIGLYTDTSLSTPIKYCFMGDFPNRCVIKKNKFVVYSNSDDKATYVAIRLSKRSSNCVFEETTYFVNKLANFTIAAASNSAGSCLITLLLDGTNFYYFSNLWTTSKTKNVKIFVGIDQTKQYFEFNYKTQKVWTNIPLYSEVYTILIPSSAAIYMTLKKRVSSVIEIADNSYKSFAITPDYGCSKRGSLDESGWISVANYSIMDYPVMFTVIDYTLQSFDSVYFKFNNEIIFFNKTGEYLIFHNQNVSFFCDLFFSFALESGALFLIQTYDETLNDKVF